MEVHELGWGKRLLTIRPDGHVEVNSETTRDELITALRRLGIPASVGRVPITIDVFDTVAVEARDALISAALALDERVDLTYYAEDQSAEVCLDPDCEILVFWEPHRDDCRCQGFRLAAAAYRAAGGEGS